MANGGRIDVYFHNAEGGESDEEETKAGQDGENTTKKSGEKSIGRSMIATMGIDYAKKIASYGLSVYGDLTGDYQSQRQIEGMVSAASTLYMMSKFPVGTIAGAFSIAQQTATYFIQTEKANRESAMLLKRSGNETINNSEVY